MSAPIQRTDLVKLLAHPAVGIVSLYDLIVDSARGKNMIRVEQREGGTVKKTPVKGPGNFTLRPDRLAKALQEDWKIIAADEMVKSAKGDPARRPGLFLVVIPYEQMAALRSGLVLPGGGR